MHNESPPSRAADIYSEQSTDWAFQSGPDVGSSLGEVVLDSRFLEAGRFSRLPEGIELPSEIYVAHGRHRKGKAIPIEAAGSAVLESLGNAMTDQWGFIYERASRAANNAVLNANTLTRYAYNTFGVRRILRHLDERDAQATRVLLVTAYETPVHELLECERVGEVIALDLSRSACEVVAEKYGAHPQADKLRLRIVDFSGMQQGFQESEIAELLGSYEVNKRLTSESVRRHFSRIASGQQFARLDFDSDSFDAVHLPFVMGSLYLGSIMVVIGRRVSVADDRSAPRDCAELIGAETLRSSEAEDACMAVMDFALREVRRITKTGGLALVNLWARPLADAPGRIRMSDTLVSRKAFDRVTADFRRLFSGNPQPNLPHTVGHILELQV